MIIHLESVEHFIYQMLWLVVGDNASFRFQGSKTKHELQKTKNSQEKTSNYHVYPYSHFQQYSMESLYIFVGVLF